MLFAEFLVKGTLMPLVIACPRCRRRYDVGKRPIGSRFRCQCGAVLTIRQRVGLAAAVMCPCCGTPQHDGETACNHCGSTLQPEQLGCEKTALACPACGKGARLAKRQMGDCEAMECSRCVGLWLATDAFGKLVGKASQDATAVDWHMQLPRRVALHNSSTQGGAFYRKCPSCGKMMNRHNYARCCGVVVDSCKQHGVWFDANELEQILDWVRSGGMAKVKQQETDEAARAEQRKSTQRLAGVRGMLGRNPHENDESYVSDHGNMTLAHASIARNRPCSIGLVVGV